MSATPIDPLDFALLERTEAFLADWLTTALLEAYTDEVRKAFEAKAQALLADIRNRLLVRTA